MKPENVNPTNFKVIKVIYNNKDFSVAYGKWTESGKERLAMRWNGGDDGKGYPSVFDNPMWFQLPESEIWSSELFKAIDNIMHFENRIKDIKGK